MKKLLLLFSLFGFFMFATSCSDDDDCDIDALNDQAEDLSDDYVDACFSDFDCDDCEEALGAYVDFLKSNKGCAAEDSDFDEDDLDDLIDDLEDSLDDLDC